VPDTTPRLCGRCHTYFRGACQRCLQRTLERLNRKRQFKSRSSVVVYQSAKDAPPPDPRD